MAFFEWPGRRNRRLGLLMITIVLAVALSPVYRDMVRFPDVVRIPAESEVTLRFPWPRMLQVRSSEGHLVLDGLAMDDGWLTAGPGELALGSVEAGTSTLEIRILGFIPFRQVQVISVPQQNVVPGGESIGVLARSEGLLVIEQSPVTLEDGRKAWPGREAGIRVGDLLMSADGLHLGDAEDFSRMIQAAGERGREMSIEVKRGHNHFRVSARPQLDQESGQYLLGLWVRDGAAGVGTMTFWDPENLVYAALGHEIVDPSTGQMLGIDSGVIVEASVWGLNRAHTGQPGEKIGIFSDRSPILGDIQVNSPYGIMGVLDRPLTQADTMPVALAEEVRVGPAQILTVIKGSTVERYAVNIERVSSQRQPGNKSLIVKVVDEALLESAGGIVQGMSGSPIIQDGKVIGAITHVFLSDPTRGYGVFAEWMAAEGQTVTVPTTAPLSGIAALATHRAP